MYSYRISDPAKFFKEVSGVAAQYSGVDLETSCAILQSPNWRPHLAVPVFHSWTWRQTKFCCRKNRRIAWRGICQAGFGAGNFTVESITLPASIQAALDKKISMGVIGDLGRYTQYQTAESIPLAAQNEGGLAGVGAGLGVGAGIGQAMAGAMSGMMQPTTQQAQQNAQPAAEDPQAKLLKLKSLLDGGLISQEDFDKAKAEVLKQLIG